MDIVLCAKIVKLMKKIFLTCVVALSLFAAEAQSKKTKKVKNSYAQREARANAAFKKTQQEKQLMWETDRIERLRGDSERIDRERIADEQFTQQRMDWKTNRLKQIDSTNQTTWKGFSVEQENMAKLERERDAINTSAKISFNLGRQVKYINSSYTEKVLAINNNAALTAEQKTLELSTLNNERRTRIRAIVGKSKERKLEKERKEYVQKNTGSFNELAWADMVSVSK